MLVLLEQMLVLLEQMLVLLEQMLVVPLCRLNQYGLERVLMICKSVQEQVWLLLL
jgi:hypothetical protein